MQQDQLKKSAQKPERSTLPRGADTLLPHRPPMLLAGTLIAREGHRTVACATLPAAGLFVSPAGISNEYFIELIAQTAALGNCYDAVVRGMKPRQGMLVGIDNFCWPGRAQPGGLVHIETEQKYGYGAVKVVHGEVYADTVLLAAGDIKVWEEPDRKPAAAA